MILAGSGQCCTTHCGWVCISLAIVLLAWEDYLVRLAACQASLLAAAQFRRAADAAVPFRCATIATPASPITTMILFRTRALAAASPSASTIICWLRTACSASVVISGHSLQPRDRHEESGRFYRCRPRKGDLSSPAAACSPWCPSLPVSSEPDEAACDEHQGRWTEAA